MNIRQLEVFRATVKAGTVSGAADMLGISQPAASKFLALLERSIGIPLFERQRNRLTLTPEGRLLHDAVERTFVSVESIRTLAEEIKTASAGDVRIAATPTIAFNLLPIAISRFRASHPRVSIFVNVQNTTRVEDWVAAQQFDFGLTYESTIRFGLQSDLFCKDPQHLILPKAHPLVGRSIARPEDLEGMPFISLDGAAIMRHRIDGLFATRNVQRETSIETQLSETVCRLVELGQGAALVDSFTAFAFRQRGGNVVPFDPCLEFDVSLLLPTQRPISRAARHFLEVLKSCRDEVLRSFTN